MKKVKFLGFALILFSFLGSGCEDSTEDPVNPLTAEAGEEQEVEAGFQTVLDASQSVNSTGQPMSYEWRLIQKPEGAEVTTSNLTKAAVNFSANKVGDYVFELIVTYQSWKATDQVVIRVKEATEARLVANAGEDRFASLSQEVQLSALGSVNELGGAMEFIWEMIQKPQGSLSQIRFSDDAVTSFVPDAIGEYLIKLTVKVATKTSFDLIKITVEQGSGSEHQPILIQADITSDRVLTDVFLNDPDKLDYLVTKDVVVRGAKLTIEPGVRIGFEEGTGLIIDPSASLKAYTLDFSNKPIVFQGKQAQKGYWDGIQLLSQNPMEYISGIEIRDAGNLGYGLKVGPQTKLFLNFSKIQHNLGIGIWFDDSSYIVEFKDNTIRDNEIAPLKMPARLITSMFFENQIQNGPIQVTDGRIFNGLDNHWPNFNAEYEVLTDLVVYNGSNLIISSGTKVNMAENKSIRVIGGASLKLIGEANSPVKIESTSKQMGSWKGIYIENSQNNPSSILYSEIRHAGSEPIEGQEPSTVKLGNGAYLKMTRSLLAQGRGNGFEAWVDGIRLEFKENAIKSHLGRPIVVGAELVEYLDYLTVMEDNTIQEVAVDGFKPLIKTTGEIIWNGFLNQVPYVIRGLGKNLTIQSGLRVKAGAIIKMQPASRIEVKNANGSLGYLAIEGLAGRPVVIQGTNETTGSWDGILYSTNNTQNMIQHAEILHAGRVVPNQVTAAVRVNHLPQASLVMQQVKIAFTGLHGIAVKKDFRDLLRTSGMAFEEIGGEEIFTWE